jgi:hypothetical protein
MPERDAPLPSCPCPTKQVWNPRAFHPGVLRQVGGVVDLQDANSAVARPPRAGRAVSTRACSDCRATPPPSLSRKPLALARTRTQAVQLERKRNQCLPQRSVTTHQETMLSPHGQQPLQLGRAVSQQAVEVPLRVLKGGAGPAHGTAAAAAAARLAAPWAVVTANRVFKAAPCHSSAVMCNQRGPLQIGARVAARGLVVGRRPAAAIAAITAAVRGLGRVSMGSWPTQGGGAIGATRQLNAQTQPLQSPCSDVRRAAPAGGSGARRSSRAGCHGRCVGHRAAPACAAGAAAAAAAAAAWVVLGHLLVCRPGGPQRRGHAQAALRRRCQQLQDLLGQRADGRRQP